MSANTTVQADNETTVGIETFFEADEYSPFQLAGIVNKLLAAAEIIDPKTDKIKVLPAPMFYTYTKKGYIKTINDNRGDGRKVAKDVAVEWTSAYLAKQVAKQA
jgi:hypothetical protein